MRKTRKYIAAPKCDWCGKNNEHFITTADKLHFCHEGFIGQEPTKDCHTDYLNHLKQQKLEQEKKRLLLEEQERKRIEEKKAAFPKLNKN